MKHTADTALSAIGTRLSGVWGHSPPEMFDKFQKTCVFPTLPFTIYMCIISEKVGNSEI